MALVEAKLVKLLTKDNEGKYVNVETVEVPAQEVVRTSVFVSQESITETENNFEYTGLLYVAIPVIP